MVHFVDLLRAGPILSGPILNTSALKYNRLGNNCIKNGLMGCQNGFVIFRLRPNIPKTSQDHRSRFGNFKSVKLLCFGCSKEPSHRDGSFEYPQQIFWMRNKENRFQIRTLILRPARFAVIISPGIILSTSVPGMWLQHHSNVRNPDKCR